MGATSNRYSIKQVRRFVRKNLPVPTPQTGRRPAMTDIDLAPLLSGTACMSNTRPFGGSMTGSARILESLARTCQPMRPFYATATA